jgi:hypothetical protein
MAPTTHKSLFEFTEVRKRRRSCTSIKQIHMHTVGEAVAEGGGNRWAANTVGGEVTGASKVAVAAV